MFSNLNKNKSSLGYCSTTAQVDKIINGLKNSSSPSMNSNLDLPLMYALWLAENRPAAEKNRKFYIIYVTDGQPFPYATFTDKPSWLGKGSTKEFQATGVSHNTTKSKRTRGWWSDMVANKYYSTLSNTLRNTHNAEIYMLITNQDYTKDADGGDLVHRIGDATAMHKAITGNASNVKVLDAMLNATKSTYSSKGDTLATQLTNAFNGIVSEIKSESGTTTSANSKKMVVTDYINTNLFSFNGSSASVVCTPSIGTASIDTSSGKVTWNLGSNLPYGTGGTLKIKIKLKNESTEYWLNTNNDSPTDDKCVFEHDKGTIKVRTPWIYRELPKCTVTEKWVDVETGKDIVASTKTTVKKNGEYKTTKEDLSAYQYKYVDSSPSADKIVVTGNTTIIHYYKKLVNLSIKYVDVTDGNRVELKALS